MGVEEPSRIRARAIGSTTVQNNVSADCCVTLGHTIYSMDAPRGIILLLKTIHWDQLTSSEVAPRESRYTLLCIATPPERQLELLRPWRGGERGATLPLGWGESLPLMGAGVARHQCYTRKKSRISLRHTGATPVQPDRGGGQLGDTTEAQDTNPYSQGVKLQS